MRICFAGSSSREELKDLLFQSPFMLESFWYFKPWQVPIIHDTTDFFLLDSGAFSFIMNGVGDTDLESYIRRYIDFINKYEVEHYIEMDIDNRVGYDKVKEIRRRLERGTGRPCVPVWHVQRGREDFERMCDEYDYVAFGGMMSDGHSKDELVKVLPWFIRTAHKAGTKIHGLAFTGTSDVFKVHFDSVDSTSWLSGSRFGTLYNFDGRKMRQIKKGRVVKHYLEVDRHNLAQWLEFQKYADTHL